MGMRGIKTGKGEFIEVVTIIQDMEGIISEMSPGNKDIRGPIGMKETGGRFHMVRGSNDGIRKDFCLRNIRGYNKSEGKE